MDSEDARTCIENRFTVFAGFYRFNPDEPENEANLARSVFVQLKHAVIQARIGKGTMYRGSK